MSDASENVSRTDDALREFFAAVAHGSAPDIDAFLRRHESVRETLEPLLRGYVHLTTGGPVSPSAEPSEALRLETGQRVGRYLLEAQVGRGGMGVVWRARDTHLDEVVALKFLPGILASDELALRALREEARVLLSLTHVNIVRLRTLEAQDGLAFLVMEFLRGADLARVAADRVRAKDPLSATELQWVLEQVAPALEYAHAEGVTHRDIKPANLMLDRPLDGRLGEATARVKLTDFGLAFVATSAVTQKSGYRPSGTLPFMAPEVLMGGKPTARADVYSLAATIWALRHGTPPFSTGDVIAQVLHRAPEPLESTSAALDSAVRAGLAKVASDRPASPSLFAALARGAIRIEEARRGTEARADSQSRKLRLPALVALLAVLVTGVGAALHYFPAAANERASSLRDDVEARAAAAQARTAQEAAASAPKAKRAQVELVAPIVAPDGRIYSSDGELSLRGRVFGGTVRELRVLVGSLVQIHQVDANGDFVARVRTSSDRELVRFESEELETPLSVEIVVDRRSPSISIVDPSTPEVRVSAGRLRIAARVDDPNLRDVEIGGSPAILERDVWTASVSLVEDGAVSITVKASDLADNVARQVVTCIRDLQAPVLQAHRTFAGDGSPVVVADLVEGRGFLLALEFDEPLRELRVGEELLELHEDRRSGVARLAVPNKLDPWTVEWHALDLAGTTATGRLPLLAGTSSAVPDGCVALDRTPRAGHARRVRHEQSGVVLRLVEPGAFLLGSSLTEGRPEERPQLLIEVKQPFYLGETEVTREEWQRFVDATGYVTSVEESGKSAFTDASGRRAESLGLSWHEIDLGISTTLVQTAPVTQVSWNDASAFCAHYGLRLPREVEWEYAARCGRAGTYPWGDVPAWGATFANVADRSLGFTPPGTQLFEFTDGFARLAPVGSLRANAWGFQDLIGNAWEWCADEYDEQAWSVPSVIEDALLARPRVLRGGSWKSGVATARPARRACEEPNLSDDTIGFRVVLEVAGPPTLSGLPKDALRASKRSFARDAEGLLALEGEYERLHPTGRAAEWGAYVGGLREKRWGFRHANGKQRAKGAYKLGRESGNWQFFDADAVLTEEGPFDAGWRTGRWKAASGAVQWTHSITPGPTKQGLVSEGARLEGEREGPWTFWWPNGQRQFEGVFTAGRASGEWRFWHEDGTPDPDWSSGIYSRGALCEAAGNHEWSPFALSPLEARSRLEEFPLELRRRSPLPMEADTTPQEAKVLSELARALPEGAKSIYPTMLAYGMKAIPFALEALRTFDQTDPKARDLSASVLAGVVTPTIGIEFDWFQRDLGWNSAREREMSLLRLESLLRTGAIKEGRSGLRVLDAAVAPRRSVDAVHVSALRQVQNIPLVQNGPLADSESTRPRPALGRQLAEAAVLDGLRWLARHRGDEGSWATELAGEKCDEGSRCIPNLSYGARAEVALTSLSLLAYLGAGVGPSHGGLLVDVVRGRKHDFGELSARSIQWLVDHQAEDGYIGSFNRPRQVPTRVDFRSANGAVVSSGSTFDGMIVEHALGTLALCSAYRDYPSPMLRDSAQRAVNYILRAQLPNPANGDSPWGWGYTSKQELVQLRDSGTLDHNAFETELRSADIVNTTWCVVALESATLAGLEAPTVSMRGALDFVEYVSLQNGLVGYTSPDEAGMSLPGRDDHFQHHVAGISALGMLARTIGPADIQDPRLETGAKLLLRDLPEISKDKLSIDYHYWLLGSLALSRIDGPDSSRNGQKYWGPWEKQLRDCLLQLQDAAAETKCSSGGWLVPDRWSSYGGPIYSTTMAILALEAACGSPAIGVPPPARRRR